MQRGLHAGLPDLLHRLKHVGLTVSLDTNDDPEDRWGSPLAEVLRYVDVFLPSEDELCRMTGCANLDQAVQALPTKVPAVVVKRGSRGARVYMQSDIHSDAIQSNAARQRDVIDIAPLSVVPVDTIGAGDSFDAGFLRAYLLSKDIVTCARAGNITGALSTQAAGGTEAFRDSTQRESFLRKHRFFELLS